MAVRDGESWRYDGRHMRAIGYFEKALELNPNFVEAQYAMVVAYIQVGSGRTKPALKYTKALEKLRQMSPELAKKAENYKATFRGALTASPASVENN